MRVHEFDTADVHWLAPEPRGVRALDLVRLAGRVVEASGVSSSVARVAAVVGQHGDRADVPEVQAAMVAHIAPCVRLWSLDGGADAILSSAIGCTVRVGADEPVTLRDRANVVAVFDRPARLNALAVGIVEAWVRWGFFDVGAGSPESAPDDEQTSGRRTT